MQLLFATYIDHVWLVKAYFALYMRKIGMHNFPQVVFL